MTFSNLLLPKVLRQVPWPCIFFLIGLAIPPDASIFLGSLRLSTYRIVLIVAFLPSLYRICTKREIRLISSDYFVFCHAAWVAMALIVYAGVSGGLETAGIYFLEAIGAYLISRVYVRTIEQLKWVVATLYGIIVSLIGFAAVESITGRHIIRDMARAVLGGPPLPFIEPRMGLHRAFASFDHPILYGIFCASSVGMLFFTIGHQRRLVVQYAKTGIVLLATFFSVSSGAFSAALVQCVFLTYERITRGIRFRWSMTMSAGMGLWAVLTLVSNRSPIKVFLTYFTFSPSTGYDRIRIFELGSAEVRRHPVFGIGLGDWERPDWMHSSSIDNFWLATAVRYGLPATVFLVSAVVCQGLAISRQRRSIHKGPAIGWTATMIGLCIAGCTVHYWNALFCLFCFYLGLGGVLAQPRKLRPA
jgi:hypothetical protein